MTLWHRLRSWCRAILQRSSTEREMDAELHFHIGAYKEDLVRAGIPRDEAMRRARIEFGGVEQAKEQCRDARGVNLIDSLFQDIRYGLRMSAKNPGFTAVAILTLALGIGISTTVFSAFDAVVLRPRAVQDPDRLAFVFRTTPDDAHGRLSYSDYTYYRDHNKSFSDLALFALGMVVTSSELSASGSSVSPRVAGAIGFQLPQLLQGSAQPIGCFFVSGNYFSMLGALPLQGRLLQPEDDLPNSAPVVLISGNFWQRAFHSDPKVVGSILHLDGVAFTIVGVTPVDYVGTAPDVPSLWAPVVARVHLGELSHADLESRHLIVGEPQGRLKPGVSFSDAQSEMAVLEAQIRARNPEDQAKEGVAVLPGGNDFAMLEPWDWALISAVIAAVALLLLIACANVASLLLARSAARRKEIALRLALGAGRWRLLRQLLTESVLLAVFAGAIALPLASWMLHILVGEIASALPSFWGTIALKVSPDIRIFAFTLLISCVAGIAFGLAPALQASKADVNSALKEEGSAFGLRVSRSRLRGFLIASQMAACLILLINSALLLRGSQRALKINPGFETHRIAYLEMYNPANLHYPQEKMLQMNRSLVQGIAGIPGVQSVTQASHGPIGGRRWVEIAPVGNVNLTSGNTKSEPAGSGYSYVTTNYFETMGIPVVRGRVFTLGEAEAQEPVVVISEATAKRFWPGQDAIGKRLRIGSEEQGMSFPGEKDPFIASSEVIGISGDVNSMDLSKRDDSYVYLPLPQARQWTSTVLVRTAVDPMLLLPAIGQEVRRVDPSLPVLGTPLSDMVSTDPNFVISRVGGALASVIGVLGLLLACMGVYGLVSYSVAQRTREIGIRMALGARSIQVLRLVLIEGFRPILAGMVLGVAASAAIARLIASTLFGLNPMDVVSFSGVSLLLGAIALVATYLPARRAMRIEPMVALRHD
jgi:predicted permease